MYQNVSNHIAELLYQNDIVIVPDFGGFETNYKPAVIDAIQGYIHAPSKTLRFTENLVVNDGLLVAQIAEAEVCTKQEASDLVKLFVDDLRQRLARGETIALPKVGHLVKDEYNKLQFSPENTNFLTNSFGLNSVACAPITRTYKETANLQVPRAAVPERNVVTTITSYNIIKYAAPIAAMLLLIPILYFLISEKSTNSQQPIATLPTIKKPVSELRINKSPSEIVNIKQQKTTGSEDFELPQKNNSSDNLSSQTHSIADLAEGSDYDGFDDTPVKPTKTNKEKNIIAPETTQQGIPNDDLTTIALGLFQLDFGVKTISKKIKAAGYQPYLIKKGGKTLVTIRIDENKTSLEKVLQAAKRIEPTAFVYHFK